MPRLFCLFLLLSFSVSTFAMTLVDITPLNGKISLSVPEEFEPMPKDEIKLKYPSSRRPNEVLSTKQGTVSLAFNLTNNAMRISDIEAYHSGISQLFHSMYPKATWFRDEVIEQNGYQFFVMELITPAIDTQIHNIIYATSVDGRMMLATFNTTVEEEDEWLPTGKKIMDSMKVNQ